MNDGNSLLRQFLFLFVFFLSFFPSLVSPSGTSAFLSAAALAVTIPQYFPVPRISRSWLCCEDNQLVSLTSNLVAYPGVKPKSPELQFCFLPWQQLCQQPVFQLVKLQLCQNKNKCFETPGHLIVKYVTVMLQLTPVSNIWLCYIDFSVSAIFIKQKNYIVLNTVQKLPQNDTDMQGWGPMLLHPEDKLCILRVLSPLSRLYLLSLK